MDHLAENLEAHADRDGLSPVARAVFLSRGGHAPGTVCPSEPPAAPDRSWCYTCERFHEPMEWGEGCTGEQDVRSTAALRHHSVRREVVPGVFEVARPLRDTSWWHRRKQERACRKTLRHCWHPEGLIGWWCCECSGEVDGMPTQKCKICTASGLRQ